jgi:hypothetical protein
MGSVRIDRLDHLVLTVADIDATVEFWGPQAQPYRITRRLLDWSAQRRTR